MYVRTIQKHLFINTTELQKLLNLIIFLLDTTKMRSKFVIRYKKDTDQERWISIMSMWRPRLHIKNMDFSKT